MISLIVAAELYDKGEKSVLLNPPYWAAPYPGHEINFIIESLPFPRDREREFIMKEFSRDLLGEVKGRTK